MSGDPIPTGDIRFYDGYKPLAAGDYTLCASQTTASTDPAHPLSETTSTSRSFSIAAPRFALDPAEVQAVFPPANGAGPYDRKLPNVVLRERSLPWERELAKDFRHPPCANAPAYPWVALLVLEAGDIIAPIAAAAGANPTLVGSYPVAEFIKPTDPSILSPDLVPQREDEQTCQAIIISTTSFARLTPRIEDLPWLAHVRQVNQEAKSGAVVAGNGWFSVVVANRFPCTTDPAGTRFIAHLVSLEGLQAYLVDQPSWPSGVTKVRLASLTSWSFTSQPEGRDFTALMTGLVAGQGGGGEGLRLRLPAPAAPTPGSAAADAAAAIAQGYAPLQYETRAGDQSFAWHRGVLSPHPVSAIQGAAAFASAAAATIYDPGSGTFDLSYAACWETGRLMALRDRAYATAQQRVRASFRRTLNLVRERGRVGEPPDRAAQDPPERRGVSGPFMRWLAAEGAALPPRPGRPAAPPAHPSPPPAGAEAAVEALRALHARPEIVAMAQSHVASAAASSGPMASVIDWLGRLRLLEGVGFAHLAPDARMLPPESIRFFYVDPNALDALCDGAQSVGVQTTRDAAQQRLVRGPIRRLAIARAGGRRPALFGRAAATEAPGADPVAGFLLRSAVVSGWPGLEVKAFADSAGDQPIDPLRLDHLAADVLIGLYAQIPARIDIEEPKESIAFGAEDEWAVDLRYLAGDKVGQQAPNASITLDARYRPSDVLQVDAWQAFLIGQPSLSADASLWGPAGFALQMVSAPEQMIFANGGPA